MTTVWHFSINLAYIGQQIRHSWEQDMHGFSYKFNFVLFNLSFIYTTYIDSPNNRIVEFGRHLWRLSCPSLLLKAGSPPAGCSGLCSVQFWICPRMRIPQLYWTACSSLQSFSHYKRKINSTLYLHAICGILIAFHPVTWCQRRVCLAIPSLLTARES